jgi:predicted enzyme related to lactoylglutathione lyase
MKADGHVAWIDLTVADASALRDFYARVLGWTHAEVDMGGYADFNMNDPATGETVAGICHRLAGNADLPPAWIVYFPVTDLDRSLELVLAGGGTVVSPVRTAGAARYVIVRDPAGAVFALLANG